jgi:hypothetical protein
MHSYRSIDRAAASFSCKGADRGASQINIWGCVNETESFDLALYCGIDWRADGGVRILSVDAAYTDVCIRPSTVSLGQPSLTGRRCLQVGPRREVRRDVGGPSGSFHDTERSL